MARGALAVLVAALLAGCAKPPPEVQDEIVTVGKSSISVPNGPNAFDVYVDLARRASARSTVSLDARDTDGNRRKSLAELDPLLSDLADASRHPCTFRFEPSGPFTVNPLHKGWLLLGRALVWRIEAAVAAQEWQAAARWTVVATRFGAGLSGGDVSDATLGYGVIDGARRAIAPYLASFSVGDLDDLTSGLSSALEDMADPSTTIDHEGLNMATALREMQKALIEGQAKEYAKNLYGEAGEVVVGYASLDATGRNALFAGLVKGMEGVLDQADSLVAEPGSGRSRIKTNLSGTEAKIAKQFFSSLDAWMDVRDLTLARTRLLATASWVQNTINVRGTAPADLGRLAQAVRTDPYTGLQFGYLPLGRDFLVYSYGLDGKDDRGDTNLDRTTPDLLIEDVVR